MAVKSSETLSKIALFQGLPAEHIQELAAIAHEQAAGRSQMLISEGEEAKGFYVIVSGRVKVFKVSPEGKEQILHMFGAGEAVGEVAVFSGARFPASAEAVEKTRLMFFPKAEFIDIIQRRPALALAMLAELSRRLRRFTNLIESLSLKEVPGRLAAYLIMLSIRQKTGELTLDMSKNQLASLLGTIPETLSRILARMDAEGLIESSRGRSIAIRDREGLEELAEGERRLS